MIANKDQLTREQAQLGDQYREANVTAMMYESTLETQRVLGRLEADVQHLRGSNANLESQAKEHGRKLDDLEKMLGRVNRHQYYIGAAVAAVIGVFLLLSDHWPALRRLGDLVFGQPTS